MASAPTTLRLFSGLAAAVVAVSTAAIFVIYAAPLEPGVVAAMRVATTAVGLGALGWRSLPSVFRLCAGDHRLAARVALAAALLAVHFVTWFASLGLTSVVRSVALVSTQPLFAGVLARLVGDRATARLYIGATIAVAGAALMASETAEVAAGANESALLGDALAVIGAASAAAYLVVGRSVRDRMPLPGYLALVHAAAAVMLVLYSFVAGLRFALPEATAADYLAVVYLGLVPGMVGHGLFNWAVRHVPVHVVSLAALLEPVGASILAWILFATAVGPLEAAGALVLLVGVAVGLPRGSSAGVGRGSPDAAARASCTACGGRK
jgi:drug/metabolite transporter (DMT)-like permease